MTTRALVEQTRHAPLLSLDYSPVTRPNEDVDPWGSVVARITAATDRPSTRAWSLRSRSTSGASDVTDPAAEALQQPTFMRLLRDLRSEDEDEHGDASSAPAIQTRQMPQASSGVGFATRFLIRSGLQFLVQALHAISAYRAASLCTSA